MSKRTRRGKYVPLDWEPSAAFCADFQIPSRGKSLLKITNPSESGGSTSYHLRTGNPASVESSDTGKNVSVHVPSAADESRITTELRSSNVNESWVKSYSAYPQVPFSARPTVGERISFNQRTEPAYHKAMNEALPALEPTMLTSQQNSQDWRPDVYVQAFVPESLRAINDAPADLANTPPVEGIDFAKYISTFAGTHFASAVHRLPKPNLVEDLPVDSLDHLVIQNYRDYFDNCLLLDLEAQRPVVKSYDLFGAPLQLIDHEREIFLLKVPGMKEGTPLVDFGDFIMLRQLILDQATGLPRGMDLWLAPGVGRERGAPCPGFTGVQIRATVIGVDKMNEALLLKAKGLVWPSVLVCNVSFLTQAPFVESLQRAIADVSQELSLGSTSEMHFNATTVSTTGSQHDLQEVEMRKPGDSGYILNGGSTGHSQQASTSANIDHPSQMEASPLPLTSAECSSCDTWLHDVLFPSKSKGVQQKTLPSVIFRQTWFDTSLNYEQKTAVDAVQSRDYGSLLGFLIYGPPGTGKTKTICEMVLQLANDPKFKGSILLCAPSNPATDTLGLRLKAHLGPERMLRLNAYSRTFAEVPQELLPYCFVEDDIFSIPPLPILMAYRVVITTCRDADALVQARVTNRDLISLQKGLSATIYPDQALLTDTAATLHWAALIVDEAAQATEPETLIPLTVVAPHTSYKCSSNPILAMAGDEHQLNARTYHRRTTLHVSLFERLSKHPIYASSRSAHRSFRETAPIIQPPFVNLIRNYRSHRAILAVPSALFYAKSLIAESTDTDTLQMWSGWRGRPWPVLFACNGGVDDCEDIRIVGGGWYNKREAGKAIAYTRSLLAEKVILEQSEICIMSPFRAQVNLLRRYARDSKLWGVNIGPMEAFQGLESRFVIICTTRARRRFLEEDKLRGNGIINEAKKFNVAVTRARQGLIVLGNPWVLAIDPCWLAFMAFCRRNSMWSEDDGEEDARMHGLEEAKVNDWSPAQASATSDVRDEPLISGFEAALVYKERSKEGGSQAVRRFMNGSESLEEALWRTGLEAEEMIESMET